MWRSDIHQQDHLLRSLFHDDSRLYPVRVESEESLASSRRRRTPTRPALLPPTRPCSPLPPLIIEVEKRVNKHDHPEEFYVRLERKMKRIYRRLFIEGRNISSPMSTDADDFDYSYDDNRSEERGSVNIDIDERTDYGGHIEPVVISDRSLKRRTNNDSSESDEEEVIEKKSKRNHSSRADDTPSKSSKEEFEDETTASSIAKEDYIEVEENIEETHYANEDLDILVEDSVGESYVERDDVSYTSQSLDCIQVTFKADVHRAHSDEEIEESLEKNEVSENNSSSAPDGGVDITTPCIQPDDIHDAEPASEGIGEPLEKDEVPYSNLLAPAPDREVDIMRTPLIRPSVGSLPEHMGSNDEEPIDFEFLNRTQEYVDDDAIEERDAETQTSIIGTGLEGWGSIFYGQPRVFKLCHCKYHLCE